jgi:hypothetical protein
MTRPRHQDRAAKQGARCKPIVDTALPRHIADDHHCRRSQLRSLDNAGNLVKRSEESLLIRQ